MRKVSVFSIFAAVIFAAVVSAQMQTMGKPPQMPPRDPNQPQQMPKGTASISGNVTSAQGGRPMRRATVRIQSASSPMSRTATTDDKGNFEIKDLPAGEFTVRANKPGYLESIYGQKNPGSGRPGTPVSLKESQHLDKLGLSIPKGAVITGTIVDDVGEPAYGVPVRALRWTWRNGEKTLVAAGNATTDDRGIYRIPTLNPGDYIVMATPRADSINVDQMIADKMAVESAASALVSGGIRMNVGGSAFGGGSPDDEAPTSGYAPVFYPGTTLSNTATSVTIGPAEEKTGIDVQLQLVSLGTITGTVVGDPKTILATSIQLSDANSGLPGLSSRSANPDATGKFSFTGVAPGTYSLTAKSGPQTTVMADGGNVMMFQTRNFSRAGGPGDQGPLAPPMWAKADVSVDGRSKSDVALVMQPGMTVAGRIAFDGTGELPTDLTNIRLILGTAAGAGIISGSATGTVNPDGTFRITDVMPGKYKVSASPPRGWRAGKVDAAGKDALDFLLDVQPNDDMSNVTITFTNKPTELTGTLTDSSGTPTAAYTIVLFAADQRFWTPTSRRILTTRPSTDGKFSFRDLPPGDYRLVALDDAEPGSWFDPELLKQLVPASMSLTMTDGLRKTQDLRVNK